MHLYFSRALKYKFSTIQHSVPQIRVLDEQRSKSEFKQRPKWNLPVNALNNGYQVINAGSDHRQGGLLCFV